MGGFGGFARVFVTASFACEHSYCFSTITILTVEQMGEQKV